MRELITDRLRGTRAPADPVTEAMAALSPKQAAGLFRAPLTPAAVLVPVIDRGREPGLLLTRRTAHLTDHPGQISFPGGRVEAGDADVTATALREAGEEVGLSTRHIEVVGYLPSQPVVTGFAVTPVVGFVTPDLQWVIDRFEVAEVFEVPLRFFMAPGNRRTSTRRVRDVPLPVIEYQFEEYRIWGATATMIDVLIKTIKT